METKYQQKLIKAGKISKNVYAKYHFSGISLIVSHIIKHGWSFNSCLVMNLM